MFISLCFQTFWPKWLKFFSVISKTFRSMTESRKKVVWSFYTWQLEKGRPIFITPLVGVFGYLSPGVLNTRAACGPKGILCGPRCFAYWVMSLCKPKAVYAASERQYTAASEVHGPRGSSPLDGRWSEEIDTGVGKAYPVLRKLYRSVITKRELSNAAKMVINRSLFRSLPMVMNLE